MTTPTEPNPKPLPEHPGLSDDDELLLRFVKSPKSLGVPTQLNHIEPFIAGLARMKPMRILDAGNLISEAELQALRRNNPDAWERISFKRADSPYQMLKVLEDTPTHGPTLLVLDLLAPFLDETVPFRERSRLLQASLDQLLRLHSYSFVTVIVCLGETPDAETKAFFRLLTKAAQKTQELVIFNTSREWEPAHLNPVTGLLKGEQMKAEDFSRLYLQRRATMIMTLHEFGAKPAVGPFEVLMMLGMSFQEAEIAFDLSNGLTPAEIFKFRLGSISMQELENILSRYGGPEKLAVIMENAVILSIWIINRERELKKSILTHGSQ